MIVATALEVPQQLVGIPDIAHVSFDARRLEVKGLFQHATASDYRAAAYCLFSTCAGFRVLDEGDLLEFWQLDKTPAGWLWHISAGGWFDQEMARDGFLSSRPNGPQWPSPSEFLIVGKEFCVSVLAHSPPHIWIAEPFTGLPQQPGARQDR